MSLLSASTALSAIRHWMVYGETSDALVKLSRRELADIGAETGADEFAWRLAAERARK